MKYAAITLIVLLLFSCGTDDTVDVKNPKKSKAIPIYNQAYNENWDADKISDIIAHAKNAYVLVDPFEDNVSASVAEIKSKGNEVGAYISIGTGEDWRADFQALKPYLVTKQWGEWEGEYFVKTTTTGILDIMKARIDKISDWGCDWVEFDNMDWAFDDDYRTEFGIEVTKSDAIAYYQDLCKYAHAKGIKCMAKNLTMSASDFDGVTLESYDDDKNWWEQTGVQKFLDDGKLVFVNHYNESDCDKVYSYYKGIYNNDISFICEDRNLKKYVHFNE